MTVSDPWSGSVIAQQPTTLPSSPFAIRNRKLSDVLFASCKLPYKVQVVLRPNVKPKLPQANSSMTICMWYGVSTAPRTLRYCDLVVAEFVCLSHEVPKGDLGAMASSESACRAKLKMAITSLANLLRSVFRRMASSDKFMFRSK